MFSQRSCGKTLSNMTTENIFGSLIIGSIAASYRTDFFSQNSCFVQAYKVKIKQIATYFASAELKVTMNCPLEVQDDRALLTLTKTSVVEPLVSLHSAQSESAEVTTGENQIILFG